MEVQDLLDCRQASNSRTLQIPASTPIHGGPFASLGMAIEKALALNSLHREQRREQQSLVGAKVPDVFKTDLP